MASDSKVKPIFIFSLPRAGSTMLQRILAGHSEISSASEPWILLPLLHMLKSDGTAAVYSQATCKDAIEDLIAHMQGGMHRYHQLLREFVESIYDSSKSGSSVYFLDKTPRYYMIIPEIVEIFPDAKFVFLFRNPIHVYASILTTWGDGSFKRLFKHKIDIDKGPQLLSHGYESIKDRAYALRYEELVSDPIPHLKKLMSYLDLEYEETMLTKFTDVTFEGRAGDTTGVHAYKEIDIEGLEKWKRVFSTRFRKKILRKYVMKLPDDALATQGYHKSQLIDDIDKIKVMRLTPTKDYYYYFISELVTYLRADLFGLDKSKSFLSRLFHDYGGLYG